MNAVYDYPFAILFGKCLWHPPSGKAAVVAILWLFGQADPDMAREAITQQYIVSGQDETKAKESVEVLDACFVVPDEKNGEGQ